MKRRITTHDMGTTGIASHMSRHTRSHSGRGVLFIAILILAVIALLIGCAARTNGQTRPVLEPVAPAELQPRAWLIAQNNYAAPVTSACVAPEPCTTRRSE